MLAGMAVVAAAVGGSVLALPLRHVPAGRGPAANASAAPRPFDPAAYAASVADVDCTNAADRHGAIKPIGPLLRRLATRYSSGGPTKEEFETTDQFGARVAADLTRAFGGTDRIVVVQPIGESMTYDADRGQATVHTLQDYSGIGVATVPLSSNLTDTGHYIGTNAFGVSATVTRQTFDQFALRLFVDNRDGLFRTSLTLPMQADAARALKRDGVIVIVGTLAPPFLSVSRHHEDATIGDPSDVTYRRYDLTVRPACVIVATGGQEVGRFHL